MVLKVLTVNLPMWNCKKCLVDRKKWLTKWCARHIENFSKDLRVVYVVCNKNTATQNVNMIKEFNEIIEGIVKNVNITVEVK